MTTPNYPAIFEVSVPDAFLPRLTRRVEKAYKRAHTLSHKLPAPQASNLLPFYRCCLLDTEVSGLATGLGMTVTTPKSKRGGWFYMQVASGRVVLTVAHAGSPAGFPRDSKFRQTLAKSSQPSLHPMFDDDQSDELLLYAILITAANPADKSLVWFANIRFPLNDYSGWAEGLIDLMTRYPSASAAKRSFAEEERIENELLGNLREDAVEKRKAETDEQKREDNQA